MPTNENFRTQEKNFGPTKQPRRHDSAMALDQTDLVMASDHRNLAHPPLSDASFLRVKNLLR